MKLLSQTLPQVRQFLRRPTVFTAVVVGSLIALEILGRFLGSDIYDTLASTFLIILFAIVAVFHRERPLGWVHWLERAGKRTFDLFDRFRVEVGIDLRGSPPIPRRTPPSMWWMMAWLIVWSVVAFAVWYYIPQGWRSILVQISYVLYLGLVTVLWSILFVGGVASIYLPIMMWSHLAPRSFYRSDAPRMSKFRSLLIVLTYVAAMILAGAVLPIWTVLALSGVILSLLLVARLRTSRSEVSMIWRPRGSNRVYSVPSFRLGLNFLTLGIVFCISLILTASGGRVLETIDAERSMAMTLIMGNLFAWTLPGLFVSVCIGMFLFWLRDPARPTHKIVHVAGYFAPAEHARLVQSLKSRGWKIRFDPTEPYETDVCISLVEPEKSQAREYDPDWPLHVSLTDLEEGSVFSRLERRREIQFRRLFVRGLREIFKAARFREFNQGSGYWMAPHLWFQPAMTRDDEYENGESSGLMQAVGPPYREVFSRDVRHHLFEMMRSVEIDIIFVEDGVKFRALKRVFKRLFEIYDKSSGEQRIEEVHMQGLPKIRIMIHDLQLDMPFESNRYPEPKYDIIGRARVLHVFRDRGDQEELLDVPVDFSWSPAPLKLR